MYILKDFTSLENYIKSQIDSRVFPQGTTCSLPILKRNANGLFRTVFFYEEIKVNNNEISRPFAWTMIPTEDKLKCSFSWCKALDFVSSEEFPFNGSVSARLPNEELSATTLDIYKKEAVNLLDELEVFAFSKNLSDVQKESIARFKEFFLDICYQGLYPFYEAISPEFFEWINLVLIAKSQVSSEESQNSDDIIEMLKNISLKLDSKELQKNILDKINYEIENMKNIYNDNNSFAMERDIILVIDHIKKRIKLAESEDSDSSYNNKLINLFGDIEQDLIDILYRQGIDPYSLDGILVDVAKQKVIETIVTDDPKIDKTIAERLTLGWAKGENIIRPEYVKAYLYHSK